MRSSIAYLSTLFLLLTSFASLSSSAETDYYYDGNPLPTAYVNHRYEAVLTIKSGWWDLKILDGPDWLACAGFPGPREYILYGYPDKEGEYKVTFSLTNEKDESDVVEVEDLIVVLPESEAPEEPVPSEEQPEEEPQTFNPPVTMSSVTSETLVPDGDIDIGWTYTTNAGTYWQTFYPDKDTYIDQLFPNEAKGGQADVYVTKWAEYPGYERIPMYRFNLTSLSSSLVLNNAYLWLYTTYNSGGVSGYVALYQGNETDWDETTLTWNNAQHPVYVDKLHNFSVTGVGAVVNTTSAAFTAYVEPRLGSYLYLCLRSELTQPTTGSIGYATKENSDSAKHPRLKLQFSEPGTHYTEVDDATPDGDVTYVSDGNSHTDTFRMSNLQTSYFKSINYVDLTVVARKTTTATTTLYYGLYNGQTQSGTSTLVTSTYDYYTYRYTTNPWTGQPWTKSDLDDVMTYITTGNKEVRVTSVYITVSLNLGWAPVFTSTPPLSVMQYTTYMYTATCNESVTFYGITIPTWLSFDTETGVLTGVPSETGLFDVSIKATSINGGRSAWQNYTITVTTYLETSLAFISLPPYGPFYVGDSYNYQVLLNTTLGWGNLTAYTTGPIYLINNTLLSYFTESTIYFVSLRATNGGQASYQNYTIVVYPAPEPETLSSVPLWFGLAIGILFILLGALFDWKWYLFGGFYWIAYSIIVLLDHGLMFPIVGLGIGFVLLMTTATRLGGGGD